MIRAWHFVGDTLRDGRPVPQDGKWLVHQGPLVICQSGLHASLDPFDALQYAPGPILCLVECDGDIHHQRDKLVCRRRRIVARRDATEGLRYFARMQALSVIHLWDAPDVVLDYLMTGDEVNRDAARAAAWATASAVAWYAASAAAWDAASAAAMATASAAAWDTARASAWYAASAAARASAWAAAARDAARDAAWAAARADWHTLVADAFDLSLDEVVYAVS